MTLFSRIGRKRKTKPPPPTTTGAVDKGTLGSNRHYYIQNEYHDRPRLNYHTANYSSSGGGRRWYRNGRSVLVLTLCLLVTYTMFLKLLTLRPDDYYALRYANHEPHHRYIHNVNTNTVLKNEGGTGPKVRESKPIVVDTNAEPKPASSEFETMGGYTGSVPFRHGPRCSTATTAIDIDVGNPNDYDGNGDDDGNLSGERDARKRMKNGKGRNYSNCGTVYYPTADLQDSLPPENDGGDGANVPSRLRGKTPPKPAESNLNSNTLPLSRRNHAILTRRGNKGTSLDSRFNQDRAVVLYPFLPALIETTTDGNPPNDDDGDDEESANNGSTTTENDDDSFLIGVMDGHGPLGHYASHHAVRQLPAVIADLLSLEPLPRNDTAAVGEEGTYADPSRVETILRKSFRSVERSLPAHVGKNGGCTASILLRLGGRVYSANVGDSQSFLVSHLRPTTDGGEEPTVRIVYETRKHKPDRREERDRIERKGGTVVPPPHDRPDVSARVIIPSADGGIMSLAMSRSLGDSDGREVGVISEPSVDVLDLDGLGGREEGGLFAFVASDGLLDFISPLEVARKLAKGLYGEDDDGGDGDDLLQICEQLIQESSLLWTQKYGEYRDDITLAVKKITL